MILATSFSSLRKPSSLEQVLTAGRSVLKRRAGSKMRLLWKKQLCYSTSAPRCFAATTVPITFVEPNGEEKEVQAEIGKNFLETAHDNNIELEGACGGELACATCHLVFPQHIYDKLPEKVDEEDDMLDLAFDLTETSRLGCQVCVQEDFAGAKIRIPDDGF